ncbi:hypothetical protein MAA8898_05141 [Maliponia aquimaris]|uniref:Uncharacterized protein n=1 Tax=Maliponia aquimaris TaxID=1673631 RepID=A0A238L764_9RHOB|nr:hypothetical protein MAA8898_05141 [Maliponia aquimaris]
MCRIALRKVIGAGATMPSITSAVVVPPEIVIGLFAAVINSPLVVTTPVSVVVSVCGTEEKPLMTKLAISEILLLHGSVCAPTGRS